MQAWGPSDSAIVRHLQAKNLDPLHITLEQMSKKLLAIIDLLPENESSIPTQKLFDNLMHVCSIAPWRQEQALQGQQYVHDRMQTPQSKEQAMRDVIDPLLEVLNPEMQRLSVRLGLGPDGQGFRLVEPTRQGYQVSWEPRDPDMYNGIFNAPAGKRDPDSVLQYASYLNIQFRHDTAAQQLYLSIAEGYQPFGMYNIIQVIQISPSNPHQSA